MIAFKGVVISKKNATTVKVSVKRDFLHPMYGKMVKRSSKFLVHDTIGVEVNDHVKIAQCKPVSKLKRHEIKEVL